MSDTASHVPARSVAKRFAPFVVILALGLTLGWAQPARAANNDGTGSNIDATIPRTAAPDIDSHARVRPGSTVTPIVALPVIRPPLSPWFWFSPVPWRPLPIGTTPIPRPPHGPASVPIDGHGLDGIRYGELHRP